MANIETLQDQFLGEVRRAKTQVTVFLVNGFQLRGTVVGYDNFVLLLSSDGKQNMIYKHAISTITPQLPVKP
ncbi:MAG: RNA chaperone Hfq [Oscillospiraceae bacterium]|nr:RNA chaperone Hfq [Oscillospiraceae bacterium]